MTELRQWNNRANRAVVCLLILGAGTIGFGMYKMEGVVSYVQIGLGLWLAAYFTVLAENFIAGRPVATRGGWVRREDGTARYIRPYIVLALFGLLATLFVLFL